MSWKDFTATIVDDKDKQVSLGVFVLTGNDIEIAYSNPLQVLKCNIDDIEYLTIYFRQHHHNRFRCDLCVNGTHYRLALITEGYQQFENVSNRVKELQARSYKVRLSVEY